MNSTHPCLELWIFRAQKVYFNFRRGGTRASQNVHSTVNPLVTTFTPKILYVNTYPFKKNLHLSSFRKTNLFGIEVRGSALSKMFNLQQRCLHESYTQTVCIICKYIGNRANMINDVIHGHCLCQLLSLSVSVCICLYLSVSVCICL